MFNEIHCVRLGMHYTYNVSKTRNGQVTIRDALKTFSSADCLDILYEAWSNLLYNNIAAKFYSSQHFKVIMVIWVRKMSREIYLLFLYAYILSVVKQIGGDNSH